MIKVLKIVVHCTYKLPTLWPTIKEVVKMFLDVDPCSGNFRSVQKVKDHQDANIDVYIPTKPKYQGKY